MTLWMLFIGTLLLSLLAAVRVKPNYHRLSRLPARSGLSGAEAAQEILPGIRKKPSGSSKI